MSDADTTPPRKPQRQYLSQSIAALFVAVDEVHVELATTGDVSEETRSQLQSELASLIFQLRQYRDEDGINWVEATPFESPDDLLANMLQGDEGESMPSGQHNPQPERQRQPVQISADVLYQSALDMIDIVRRLGLSAEIDQNKDKLDAEFPS